MLHRRWITRDANNRTRDPRPFWIGLTGLMLVAVALEAVFLYGNIDGQHAVGADFRFYQSVAQRWVDTGVYYTDRELAGPFQVQTQVDNLYPPHALFLFVPFLVLPYVLWWILPLGLVGYVVWWCRPAAWALPLLALLVMYPWTIGVLIYGNTDAWVTAVVAAGVRWGWPAVLVTFKPSVGFLAGLGVRTRAWWIAAGVLFVACLPLGSLWLDYPKVLSHSSARLGYTLPELPFLLIPVVAWLGSTRRDGTSPIRWVAALLSRGPGEASARS